MRIRDATSDDAAAISALIVRNLREVNAHDYPPAVLKRLVKDRTPRLIRERIDHWHVLVAEEETTVVGTAALEGNRLRMFFVLPDRHQQGIGSALLTRIQDLARGRGVTALEVASSVVAQGFYRRRGFIKIRDVNDFDHTTILMRKPIAAKTSDLRNRLSTAMARRSAAFFGR